MTAPAQPHGPTLGAPGLYRVPRVPEPAFTPVRLDVTAFVGVALRGPVDTPVAVGSWTEYRQRFGGFEGPAVEPGEADAGGPDRMLPYAVQAFFAQGGTRAHVVRVTARDPADSTGAQATASFTLAVGGGVLAVAAADEGSWGDRLTVRLEFEATQSFRVAPDGQDSGRLAPPAGVVLPAFSLVRVRRRDLPPAGALHWVVDLAAVPEPRADGRRRTVAVLDPPLPEPPEGEKGDADVAVVTGVVVVTDADPGFARSERIGGLGLHPGHARYAGAVLAEESLLVAPGGPWDRPLTPGDATLPPVPARRVRRGVDRWVSIDFRSFFDDEGAAADPLDEDPHRGVDAAGRVAEAGLLCVPDLAWRWQGAAEPPEPPGPPDLCAPWPRPVPVTYAPAPAPPATLDPRDPEQLAELVDRQLRATEVARLRRRPVLLLDVPRGLAEAEIARWRARFDSPYVAAYHPWLGVRRVGGGAALAVDVAPSAFAAGITASRERRFGLSWGPANELAAGAVRASAVVTDAEHDRLHLLGVNVFRAERDGFRLTAARTLATDPANRQLSVRRLMTMLELTVERQAQWLVFEPNTADLRERLADSLTQLLRGLHRRGAFAGDTERDSFFVRCDDRTNPLPERAAGRLLAEIGVAPAAPLEYLVLRITQDVGGDVAVEAAGRATGEAARG